MLDLMRRFASTWVGRVLGLFLLVGLAGFGISNVILDLGSNTLMKIGDDEISTQDFQRAYQNQLNRFAQQAGQMPTNEQALQMGIPTQVLYQLAAQAAIDNFATTQGIGVSDAHLAKMTRDNPTFAGVLGTFDKSVFSQALQQNGMTEAQYFQQQTRQARTEQVARGLLAGLPVPKTAETMLQRYRNDTRTVEYFTLNSISLPDLPAPTDDDLKKYLADNQKDFRTKEMRTADVLVLSPELLATQADYTPTEDAIKAEYDRTKDQLTVIEKRDVQQVVLSDPSKEEFFKPGVKFLDAVKAAGVTATDFGLVAKTELTDTALADAAFGLAEEGDFVVIPGIGAKRVVAVTKIEGGGTPTYEQVKDQVAKNLAVAKAKAAYPDIQDQVEELRAAFKPLKDVAARYKLPVTTVAVTQGGAELSTVPGLDEANRPKVATAIFAASVGKLPPTVAITATDNVYFELSKVDEARDQTLDEVKDKVTDAWTAKQTADALAAEVKSITAELDVGKAFQDLAAEKSQFATISPAITRDGDKTQVLNQAVATQIFSSGPGSHGAVIDGDGDWVVYHVVDATPATGDPDKNIQSFLKDSTTNALYDQFVTGVTDAAWPQTVRQGAYARMLQQLTPAQ